MGRHYPYCRPSPPPPRPPRSTRCPPPASASLDPDRAEGRSQVEISPAVRPRPPSTCSTPRSTAISPGLSPQPRFRSIPSSTPIPPHQPPPNLSQPATRQPATPSPATAPVARAFPSRLRHPTTPAPSRSLWKKATHSSIANRGDTRATWDIPIFFLPPSARSSPANAEPLQLPPPSSPGPLVLAL